ncbi:HD domain-containing protein [uncultured Treponema sp.]|uniref:HD domain-containing protein n=1 Tax=uncultured Treponema sp. TaxID=162155 RepID=UPI0025916B8F|nr:HD domain-containing protein [uncultured Treponema sp.]
MKTTPFLPGHNERLNKQLLFTAEIDKMTHVLRRTLLTDGSRRENDAEHSWHIAVMALLFEEYAAEKPDTGRAAKMLVVHDLIEIYAGDTFAYDEQANLDKEEREKNAADKLFSQLPPEQGKEIRSLWEEFDAMQTADSKYANCMDRIQPFLHNTLTGGHTWIQAGAKRSMVEKRMEIVRDFMPDVWKWAELNIQNGIKEGWITDCQTA